MSAMNTTSHTTRSETDSLGTIDIPAERAWGPQTERARRLFFGRERLPAELIAAVGLQKQAAARANRQLGALPATLAAAIEAVAARIAAGDLDAEFPLPLWQTGSGTQTNMNANEVIANLANEALGGQRGQRAPIHPNDHVNRGQSSNDSFPTAMHIAALRAAAPLCAALRHLAETLAGRADAWQALVKVGRTHLMDAVPVTLGQEARAWHDQLTYGIAAIERALPRLRALPQGGTAAGTGLNSQPGFASAFCEALNAIEAHGFHPATNLFEPIGAHDALVELSGVLNTLAVALNKIANDIRLLGSGPRCGFGDLVVPEDGLSSSIMPGKTNPTQCEALTMACARVMGNHLTVTLAGAQSMLELNVFKPVLIDAVLQSMRLLTEGARSFADHMVAKLEPNRDRIADHLARSLMLVTALNPHIGYDRAVAIGKRALTDNLTLREAALRLGAVTAAEFDAWVRPEAMLAPEGLPDPTS